jgi:hypothetical protein
MHLSVSEYQSSKSNDPFKIRGSELTLLDYFRRNREMNKCRDRCRVRWKDVYGGIDVGINVGLDRGIYPEG